MTPATVIIRAAVSPGEIRAVACDAIGPLDIAIERPGAPDGVGDLHRGRITARRPALAGSFVRLHDGTEGFLPDSAGGDQPEGTILPVRIIRAAQGGKGPRLTARLPEVDHAPGPVALLQRGPGAIERLAMLHPDAPITIDDAPLFAALHPRFGDRLSRVSRSFDESLESELDLLAEPHADLPGGVRMSVHPTPALTAIDMDLGAASTASSGKARTHEQANRAALPALARQIRLRNLSGAIVLDLAGLTPKRRAALAPAVAAALESDPLNPRFLGFTALGLAEILRPRIHPPLHEVLAGSHAAALAALRHAFRQAAAKPHARLALRAGSFILDAVRADPMAISDFTMRAGHPIALRLDSNLPSMAWTIEETAHG